MSDSRHSLIFEGFRAGTPPDAAMEAMRRRLGAAASAIGQDAPAPGRILLARTTHERARKLQDILIGCGLVCTLVEYRFDGPADPAPGAAATYSVHVTGRTRNGIPARTVMDRLQSRLGLPLESIRKMIANRQEPVKRDLTEDQALRLVRKFLVCGLDCHVMQHAPLPEPAPAAPAPPPAAPAAAQAAPAAPSAPTFDLGGELGFGGGYDDSAAGTDRPRRAEFAPESWEPHETAPPPVSPFAILKPILRKILCFVPGFFRLGTIPRAALSACLALILILFGVNAVRQEILPPDLRLVPVNVHRHALDLCRMHDYAGASALIAFYEQVPSCHISQETMLLKKRLDAGEHLPDGLDGGLFSGEGDDIHARLAGMASRIIPAGGLPDLIAGPLGLLTVGENEEISLALSTMSHHLDRPFAEPARPLLPLIRAALPPMSHGMKTEIAQTLQRCVTLQMLTQELEPLLKAAEVAGTHGETTAVHLIGHSGSLEELARGTALLLKLGGAAAPCLVRNGGQDILPVLRIYGEHDMAVVRRASAYENGLSLLRMSRARFEKAADALEGDGMPAAGKAWKLSLFHLLLTLLSIWSGLALFKMWCLRPDGHASFGFSDGDGAPTPASEAGFTSRM